MELDSDSTKHTLKTQIIRFVIVGGVSAIVDFGSTYGLIVCGFSDSRAKTVGFILGTLTAYLINRRWTFQAAPSVLRFVVTMATYLLTYCVQCGLFLVSIPFLEDLSLSRFWVRALSFVIAQGAATILNFIIQRWLIFGALAIDKRK